MQQSMDALHAEIAAARTPSTGGTVVFLVGLFLPVLLVVWLVHQVRHSAIEHDVVIRRMIRAGLSDAIILACRTAGSPDRRQLGETLGPSALSGEGGDRPSISSPG